MSTTATAASPPRPPPPAVLPARLRERRALGFLALGATAILVRLAMPVSIGLFLGALLAFTLEPLYARLRKHGLAPNASALICSLAASVAIGGAFAMGAILLATSGLTFLAEAQTMFASGAPLRAFIGRSAAGLAALHINVEDLYAKFENGVLSLGSQLAGLAADVAGLTFTLLLALFFMTMASYSILRHWSEIVRRAEQLAPFNRRHTHALLDQLRSVGRHVLLGTVVTGLLQGFLAAIGYWIAGVRAPAFFGGLTAVASLVPAIGSVLVWASVGTVLLLTHHVAAGLEVLIYGALVVGILTDYVIRPRVVGSEKGVPAIFMFIALFGGVEVFGVIGLIVGPVIVTLSLAVLKTYEDGASSLPLAP